MGIRTNSTIAEAYPAEGIMTNLKARKISDWLTATEADHMTLFDTYIKTEFGDRILSNLGSLVTSNIDGLTDLIFSMFGTKWARLWTDYTAEYNPIWNVDGTTEITEERNLTAGKSGTGSYTDSGSDVTSRSGTDTQTNTNEVQGFNSTAYTPNVKDTTTVSPGTSETLTHGKITTESRDFTDTDTGTIKRTEKRGGNIGVTMTQQMLEADSEYWNKDLALFYNAVILDIVTEITYKIYYKDEL